MAIELPPVYDPTVPPAGVPLRPATLDIAITGRCNLKCGYCYYANEMVALGDLPTERWLEFFAEIGALGVQRVTLTGGEVFTRSDLWTMIDGVIANKMRYSLITNGTLIDEDAVAALRVGKRRLRLDSIQVSIDGSCAEIHNRSRPPDSFNRALRGLRLLVAHDFPVTVRVTINRHNVDDLENTAQLLLDDVGLSGFSTNEAELMGQAGCTGSRIALTEIERRRAMETLGALTTRYGGRISAAAGPLVRERSFKDIAARLERGETGMPGCGTLSACGSVFHKMAVLHDGTMVPCNMLPTLTMGVIGVNRLQDVWLHHPSVNVVRYRRQTPIRALETCRDCAYAGFCTGGCPGSVMAKTGRLYARDPWQCYRLHVESAGPQDRQEHL